MKYPVALISLICFCLTACVDQPPAPIEYKEGAVSFKSSDTFEEDEGVIVRQDIETPKKRSEEPKVEIAEDDNDIVEVPVTGNEDMILEDDDEPKLNFTKPVDGEIITDFEAGKSRNIDIAVQGKSKVSSIGSGIVTYSDNNAQFGNLVIVKLDKDEFEVAYAGLKDLSVKKGDKVTKGSLIGHVEDKLYFAMRKNKLAVNPTKYIAF
ncbi:MAG TPA: M23 family metallopeptidase [Rickettsia endosymbiont of Pyrocoelia pectoralis]|nr:M23 family metallopeptidase [Rickettsia endosymbiont of Pyrocoelia pectoralis]